MTSDGWFPRVPKEVPSRFLARARELAPAALGTLVGRQATEAHPGVWDEDESSQGVVLTVQVPRRAGESWHLQARLHHGDLTAAWGDEMYFDGVGPGEPETFTRLKVIESEEEAAAEAVVEWMARQLTRPMRIEQWNGRRALVGSLCVVAERVVFGDTETVLRPWGTRWIRRHGAPDRILLG